RSCGRPSASAARPCATRWRASARRPRSRPRGYVPRPEPSRWRWRTTCGWPTGRELAGGFAYTSSMSNADHAFDVEVVSHFLDDQSDPEDDRFVFSYTVHIRNRGRVPAQLVSRHWVITDANGKVEEVRGR